MNNLCSIAPTDNELCHLSDNQQALVVAHLAGESYREIAFNFNLPIGTVKSRLSRATAKLLENRELKKHGINQ